MFCVWVGLTYYSNDLVLDPLLHALSHLGALRRRYLLLYYYLHLWSIKLIITVEIYYYRVMEKDYIREMEIYSV